MKPVILKADQSGKILITAEEIEKIVSDAYDQGYQDGKGAVTITYDPQTTWNKWPPTITCDSVTLLSNTDSH